MLVIGLGNAFRGDDAAGLEAERRLSARGIRTLAWEGEPVGLIDRWEDEETVIVIDAASSGDAPGTIASFDATHSPIPAGYARRGTHAVGLAEAIELARALGRMPHRLLVYVIEGATFETGDPLSPDVDTALDLLVSIVTGRVGMLTG